MLRKTMFVILGLIGALILSAVLYLNFSPQVGGDALGYASPNFKSGKFENLVPTQMSSGDSSMLKSMYRFFFQKDKDAFPKEKIKTLKLDKELLTNLSLGEVAVTWLGHSTVLIKTKEVTIITDPVLSNKKLPPMFLGPKPFPYTTTYSLEDLPKIDVVLISHDHYDHLDMETIKNLKDSRFYVPLGVKSHLLRWGIEEANVVELDWYDEIRNSENTNFILTPARHFSGRGLFNRNSTLWGSWVINLRDKNIYFGGDSGYFEEFKRIGEKFGPFDLAFLDTGQYNQDWKALHMHPDEVVQAGLDLKAKTVLPIHNSKFALSLHSWYEPLERLTAEARRRNLNVITPKIGQTFLIGDNAPSEKWWKNS